MASASAVTYLIILLISENIHRIYCNAWVFSSRPESYTFTIPRLVYRIRVLAMGAGGRGAAGNGGGGGSGRLRFWELNVQPLQEITIRVGGTRNLKSRLLNESYNYDPYYNLADYIGDFYDMYLPMSLAPEVYSDDIKSSSFGNYTAAGGEDGVDGVGGNGGSGGGSPTPPLGEEIEPSIGGFDGSHGVCFRTLSSYRAGRGQSKIRWQTMLNRIKQNKFVPLPGGAGGTPCPSFDGGAGGGGGGGLKFIKLKNNFEFEPDTPIPDPEHSCGYGESGRGYGFGGGAGGMMLADNMTKPVLDALPGSDGGRGFVYLEWD